MCQLLWLPVVAYLTTCAAIAQTAPDESVELGPVRDRLKYPELENRARGVFQARRYRDASLQASLIDERWSGRTFTTGCQSA